MIYSTCDKCKNSINVNNLIYCNDYISDLEYQNILLNNKIKELETALEEIMCLVQDKAGIDI